jgi:hypothetical protein
LDILGSADPAPDWSDLYKVHEIMLANVPGFYLAEASGTDHEGQRRLRGCGGSGYLPSSITNLEGACMRVQRVLMPDSGAESWTVLATTTRRSIRRRGSSKAGKNDPSPHFRDAQLHVAGLGRQQPGAGAVAVGGALVAPGADARGGFGVDQGCSTSPERLADDVEVAVGAQCIQQLRQGRLVEGHRGGLLGVHLGRDTLSFTRWPSPCYSTGRALPSKSTTFLGRLPGR